MMAWEAVVTGIGGGFIPLKGNERVGEICVGDDELGFEVEMGNKPTEQEEERRRKEVEEWRISRCWELLSALGRSSWSTPGTTETLEAGEEFAFRRCTSLPWGTAYRPRHARSRLPASPGAPR